MAFMQWNDDLSIGIPAIDGQHRRLVGLIAGLHDAMARGDGQVILASLIDELVRYTNTHFSTEERLFARHKYPGSKSHIDEHTKFCTQIEEFRARFKAGSGSLSVSVMNFLKDWLIHHIQGTDRQYAPFLESRIEA
jgi:hemerythrin-like metal-binding protein